jgi:hypothetical protein
MSDEAAGEGHGARGDGESGETSAAYVFGVVVRLDPEDPGVWADPAEFETTVFRRADPPSEDGWLYFRDNLWKGDLADPPSFRERAEETLAAPVARVDFRELRTTREYLEDLRAAVGDDLSLFNADTVDQALSKYLGSSIHVVDSV